ncbi:MAG: hypothetical protein V7711_11640 [Pseudomonadales bacterium]
MKKPVLTYDLPSYTPRRLILDLLDAEPELMAASKSLISAGEVFGFSGNQMRVALSRLHADGLLDKPFRGSYCLSHSGLAMGREIERWRVLDESLVPWRGDWCAVLTQNLAEEGSTQLRAQTRALQLRGLQRWRPGLWVRPNNLSGGIDKLINDLTALGLDAIRGHFLIHAADDSAALELRQLWDIPLLNTQYSQRLLALESAASNTSNQSLSETLVQYMELGSDTIRLLLKDPLLPDELVHAEQRRSLVKSMRAYDEQGRKQWLQFIHAIK